jgi:P-type E1-E2 ATPase
MGKVDCVVFDKTGTLTCGKLSVSDVIVFDPQLTQDEFLSLTASAESRSEHPLAKTLVRFSNSKENNIELHTVTDFKMTAGKGISATIDFKGEKRVVVCGNFAWPLENGVESNLHSQMQESFEKLREQGKAIIFTAIDGEVAGIIALCDVMRETSADVVAQLHKAGLETVLLTGDHEKTAAYFAEKAGIARDSVYSELLPENKAEKILDLQSRGKKVCMVGDGVNDAPALKTADVGVAMASMGSDIAIEAADIALMGDDTSKIPYLKRLSNATVKMIYFNVSVSIVFNISAIVLSVLGLLNPISGALAHNFGSIAVISNAALLYDRRF